MRITTWCLAGALGLLGVFLAAPARAEVGPGDFAPDFEGREFFNTDPTTLKDQRGRLVFLELFSTG